MEKFYKICIPVNIDRYFVYKSENDFSRGSRVIVNFNSKLYTGIVWEKIPEENFNYKIKKIHESLDSRSILTPELLKLSKWIKDYYFEAHGMIITHIIPKGFKVEYERKVRFLSDDPDFLVNNKSCEKIFNFLKEKNEWIDIQIVKKILKESNLYSKIEKLEDKGLIEVKRTFEKNIKKKKENYVRVLDTKEILTEKQRLDFNFLQKKGREIRLKEISNKISYYMLKKLEEKNMIEIFQKKIKAKSYFSIQKKTKSKSKKIFSLSDEQTIALEKTTQSINKGEFKTFLLFGVTGSGKTEIYLRSIKKTLEMGKNVLMLVPEISLTPQLIATFQEYFGEKDIFAILHSHLSTRERKNEWNRIIQNKAKIVFGVRSAIFAPLKNIGLVIVDEEHESTYKQETTPRYNARDLAVLRGKYNNATVILGSATPSFVSLKNVENKKYELLTLNKRPSGFKLPELKIIDMKKDKNRNWMFSEELLNEIKQNLQNKEQTILLMNRRGYSSFIQCNSCGETIKCSNCEISMKYHKNEGLVICHYCGKKEIVPRKCPNCNSRDFKFGAPGTEQLEKQLKIIFPENKILRMDTDTTRKKNSFVDMYSKMINNEVDILLGTQMITKGLNFPNVTLVGVISADIGLNLPNYRASEIVFQQLIQVSGRSGRGEKKGRVLIQTSNVDNFVLKHLLGHDYKGFVEEEMNFREAFYYPPFAKLARIIFSSDNPEVLEQNMQKITNLVEKVNSLKKSDSTIILGPIETYFYKINNRYRYHMIIKAKDTKELQTVLNFFRKNIDVKSKIRIHYDVDCLNLL